MDAKLLGIVINMTPTKRLARSYSSYGYGYGYGYQPRDVAQESRHRRSV